MSSLVRGGGWDGIGSASLPEPVGGCDTVPLMFKGGLGWLVETVLTGVIVTRKTMSGQVQDQASAPSSRVELLQGRFPSLALCRLMSGAKSPYSAITVFVYVRLPNQTILPFLPWFTLSV